MLDFSAYLASARQSYYERDTAFRALWLAGLPDGWRAWADERATSVGERAATAWADWARTANEQPPRLRSHNAWGQRIDEVAVHPAYDQLAREAYEAGVVWPRFTPDPSGDRAPWALVFGLGYMFGQAEQGMFCPVCLTAGTAWVLDRFASPELKARFLPHVAATRYEDLYEGAMFLTERAGGSDVGANTTEARLENGSWKLYGDKWFCSNAGRARAMLVLARPEGAAAGTRGLGLFLVPREGDDGARNAFTINRLKDKLGTLSMPSGEIAFEGAIAYPVGPVDRGFAQMAEMLNLSRIYNAVGAVANMRRVLNEAIAYAGARVAFGQTVIDYPMVRQQLVEQTVEQEAALRIVFESISLLDRLEAGQASARDALLLRLLTPIVKYHTARTCVDMASWGMELLGGNGYIEEWPMARFLRDAQVLAIWEGTTNILVLDVLRSFAKENTGPALLAELGARLSVLVAPALAPWREALVRQVADLEQHLLALGRLDPAALTLHAKAWCDRVMRLYQGLLLLESASQDLAAGSGRGLLVFATFLERHLAPRTWRDALAAWQPAEAFAPIVRNEAISSEAALDWLRGSVPTPARSS